MNHQRRPHRFVNALFVVMIFCPALIQVALEAWGTGRIQALDLFRRRPSVANFRAYEEELEEASWLVQRLRPWMQLAQLVLLRDAGEKVLAGRDGWFFYRPGVTCLTQRPRSRETGGTVEAVKAITAFRDGLAARGLHLIVVPAPNKESIYPEKATLRAAGRSSLLGGQTRALLGELQRAGVEVVDLFTLFASNKQSAAKPAPFLYLAQDSHWSPAGVELAARAVAQRIRQLRGVRGRSMAYESRLGSVERVGDVLRMLRVPQIERFIDPERVVCRQVVNRATGRLYEDDRQAEVLVLGDSFLRVYQSDEPGAAGFSAHLARELGEPVTSLISDGGASTLVRQELYRRPALLANKRVVVWEFVERDVRLGTEGWQLVPLPPLVSGPASRGL